MELGHYFPHFLHIHGEHHHNAAGKNIVDVMLQCPMVKIRIETYQVKRGHHTMCVCMCVCVFWLRNSYHGYMDINEDLQNSKLKKKYTIKCDI